MSAQHETPMSATDAVRALAIDGELNIYRADELRAWLAESIPSGGALRLDLEGVSDIDTAGVQLLLMGRRLAAERGCAWHCDAASPAVRELLDLFDLSAQLLTAEEVTP